VAAFLPLNAHGIPIGPAVEAADKRIAERILAPRYGSHLSRIESAVSYAIGQEEVNRILRDKTERWER
jgi:hypothetical protein